MAQTPLKVFVSYSHEDEPLKIRLRKQLAALERAGLLKIWDDRAIPPGGNWEQAIRDELEAADLVMLLLSSSFISSEYCYGEEMVRAVERHVAGRTTLVPVVMRACLWKLLPFVGKHKIQMLPRDAKPVTDPTAWPNEDVALEHVASELLALVKNRHAEATATAPAPPPPAETSTRPDIPSLLPDLCNRGDQDSAVDRTLRASRLRPQRRPFVFVLFGQDSERLHGFRERLELVRIPRALGLDRDQTSIDRRTLNSPALSVYPDAIDAFRAELGEKLVQNSEASAEMLFAHLAAHQRPVMLVSHFVGRDGLQKLRKVAAGMFEFWSRWPDLPTGRSLLHCLSVRFEHASDAVAEREIEETRRMLRRWGAPEGGFRAHPQVAGLVVPELASVRQHHVEEWAELLEVQKFSRIQPEDVATLFQQHPQRKPDGSVAMEPLHKPLADMARRCRV